MGGSSCNYLFSLFNKYYADDILNLLNNPEPINKAMFRPILAYD